MTTTLTRWIGQLPGPPGTSNESISSLVEILEDMSHARHVDGSCAEMESNPCVPYTDGQVPSSGHLSRDSYNAWDIADAVPGNDGAARVVNCVDGAED